MEEQFTELIKKLIASGASADELQMWEAIFPLMQPEEQKVLIVNFSEELEILNSQKQTS